MPRRTQACPAVFRMPLTPFDYGAPLRIDPKNTFRCMVHRRHHGDSTGRLRSRHASITCGNQRQNCGCTCLTYFRFRGGRRRGVAIFGIGVDDADQGRGNWHTRGQAQHDDRHEHYGKQVFHDALLSFLITEMHKEERSI